MMGGLTGKQRIFIDEYIKCLNAIEAARRAGYKGNERTLGVVGHENLNKPKIKRYIAAHFASSAMGREEVLERLGGIARAEYTEYLTEYGTVDLKALLADGKGHLIKGVKETAHGRQIEFYDAQKALVDIGRHHALFVDRREHTGKDGGPIVVKGYTVISPDDWPEKD